MDTQALRLRNDLKRRGCCADVSRMKSRVAHFACLLILFDMTLTPGWAQNADEAGVRSKILALEHAWNQAEAFKDLKALDSILDNSLIYVDFDGSLMTKADFLSRVRASHLEQVITESMSVQVFGEVAIATGTYLSKEFKDGKTIERRGRFVDAWVRKNQSWVCVAAQATPILR
jgi:ketosteroid isomerase-like protein